jgi:hypothetical protein
MEAEAGGSGEAGGDIPIFELLTAVLDVAARGI